MEKPSVHIVWFKRDLRITDHQPLALAAKQGAVLPIYIFEPDLWRQPDLSHRQFCFLRESVAQLQQALAALGQPLQIYCGEALEVLEQLQQRYTIAKLWSHQETWNDWTYQRDRQVLWWCRDQGIEWQECVQHGVVRRLKTRARWAGYWQVRMSRPILAAPKQLASICQNTVTLPTPEDFGLAADGCIQRQTGGRTEGLRLLNSFLTERGEGYQKGMSSPVTAFEQCSRLSAHLAFGTLSLKEIYQAAESRLEGLATLPRHLRGKWPRAIKAFIGRLHWHCHFMQKLEDEPQLEFKAMHPLYQDLDKQHPEQQRYFAAWCTGQTGFPMVDACMRALIATGWLNFRMRAMLMSFSSYHLWLDWRPSALHLARLFTDYEPGIHYNQVQMQSGITGINGLRMYNPIKQSYDQDPDGLFIRQWIPELAQMPDHALHTPWVLPKFLGDYPLPLVDEAQARREAGAKMKALRLQPEHRAYAQQVYVKHGSRKRSTQRTSKNRPVTNPQLELFSHE